MVYILIISLFLSAFIRPESWLQHVVFFGKILQYLVVNDDGFRPVFDYDDAQCHLQSIVPNELIEPKQAFQPLSTINNS